MFFKNFLLFVLCFVYYSNTERYNRKTSFELSRECVWDEYSCLRMSPPKSVDDAYKYYVEEAKYQDMYEKIWDIKSIHYKKISSLYNIYIVLLDFCRKFNIRCKKKKLWNSVINYSHIGWANCPSEITFFMRRKDKGCIEYYPISFSYIIFDQMFDVFEKKDNKWCLIDDLSFDVNNICVRSLINSSSTNEYGISQKLFNFMVFLQKEMENDTIVHVGRLFYCTLIDDINILHHRKLQSYNHSSCIKNIFCKKLTQYGY